MPQAKQPYLHDTLKPRAEHGGEIRKGRRKLARPVDPKRPLHVVLRSEKAKGEHSLLYGETPAFIQALLKQLSRRHRVKVYEFANSGNHLHLLVKGETRKGIQNFLRVLAGKVAQCATGAKKGACFGKFWGALAYSRVVEWGRAFTEAKYYVLRNELETLGLMPHFRKGRARPP